MDALELPRRKIFLPGLSLLLSSLLVLRRSLGPSELLLNRGFSLLDEAPYARLPPLFPPLPLEKERFPPDFEEEPVLPAEDLPVFFMGRR